MTSSLLATLGLLLILEGAMPFLLPTHWRETIRRMVSFKDGQIRFVGMSSIVLGVIIYWMAHD